MSNNVELTVRSGLNKVLKELEEIKNKAEKAGEALKEAGAKAGEDLDKQTKKTEGFLGGLRSLSRRVADQIKGDFRALASINAIGDSLKLSNQFRGAVKEVVTLNDTIRKLATTFGIAKKDYVSFETRMVKGLGTLGLDTDVGARTMQSLATTTVRGQDQLVGYSQQAGMLASISKTKGSEGDIAKGIAEVIQARGGNVNDMKQVTQLSEDLRRVYNATGKGPAETLKMMQDLFAKMPQDMRKSISSKGLTNLAAASTFGGPNATKFLEEYLGKSPIARMAFEAQGGKGIFNDNGLDVEKFQKFFKDIMGRVGGDPRLAAQTLGLSEDAAEGFIRLAENLDKVQAAQARVAASTGDLNKQYKESMSLGESFKASINQVKSTFAKPFAWLTDKATDVLSEASQSKGGSAAVVAGGGLLAALLAGGGLKGIGKGLGSLGKGAIATGLTGQEVQPVYVVNASEIGGGSVVAGGKGGALGKVALGVTGAAVGLGVANSVLPEDMGQKENNFLRENVGDKAADVHREVMNFLGSLINKTGFTNYPMIKDQKVVVETNERQLKVSKQPTRGSSF